MAWTTPMTAVSNNIFTASQFNTYVRDNLNETMPAKATAAGQYFVSSGSHALAARTPASNTITSADQFITGDNTWYDMTNCAVTVTTGTKAVVHMSSYMSQSNANIAVTVSYRVSGATTLTSSDHPNRIVWDGNSNSGGRQGSWGCLYTLNAGSNTFTMQATSSAGTLRVTYSHIIVLPMS